MAPWVVPGLMLLLCSLASAEDAPIRGQNHAKIRDNIVHHIMLDSRRSSLHDDISSLAAHRDNASYDSVLRAADASRQQLGYTDIMMAMMDGNTAEFLLPHFLYQLHALKTGVYKCLVLVALDAFALSKCRSLHVPELCFLLDVSSLQGQKRYDYYIALGWKKTQLIGDALERGHSIFFSDMDIVYLKDPLADVAMYSEDILVADDHVDGAFDPYAATGEANIGTLVMRPTEGTKKFMKRWLKGREAKRWDQQYFGITAKIFVAMHPAFQLRVLGIEKYPFACPQAPGCGHALACNIAKYNADWRSSCSLHLTSNWVSLHLACLDKQCVPDMEVVDRGLLYAHVMGAVRSLVS